jgi:diacylglycerol kinase (ATP)
MDEMPRRRTGLTRVWCATVYSLNGLRVAFAREVAFRQETIIYVPLMIVLCVLPLSTAFKSVLFLASTLVLIVEVVNSAIESIVDMASPEYNELAKRAKDLGSGAVFISILLAVVLWGWAAFLLLAAGSSHP